MLDGDAFLIVIIIIIMISFYTTRNMRRCNKFYIFSAITGL